MLKNYFKTILADLRKHKVFSIINILGLSIGIACCILITAYIYHELSYDRFHEKADRIYRLRSELKISAENLDIPKSSPPMGEYLAANFPEVSAAVRFHKMDRSPVRHGDKLHYEDGIFFADNSIFDIFSFPLTKGNLQTALLPPYSAVITEDTAAKYFGDSDPIGQILTVNNDSDFTVTGVVKNIPANSHIRFNMLCSFSTYAAENPRVMQNWLSLNHYTYILLENGSDYRQLEEKFPGMIQSRVGGILKAVKGNLNLSLQPLTRIHLHSNLMQEISGNSSISYVYIFAAVAVFILIIACINFMNLSTARSSKRAKEVGMRKVLGADRGRIIRQFLLESLFFSSLSLLTALLLVEMALPLFNSISGTELRIHYLASPWIVPALIGLTLTVGIFAGSYPAFFLSAYQPIRVLKGFLKTGKSGTRFRTALVVLQFTISVTLIIGTILVFSQLNYMKNRRLGFNKEQVVVIPISDESTLDSLRPLKEELLSHTGIIGAAASSHVPGQTTYINPFIPEGFSQDNMQWMGELYVDHDFISTMGVELVSGRNFQPELQTDARQSVIINETAAQKFGWTDPIGKTIMDISQSGQTNPRTIVGVVRDFHIESLHKKINPLFIGCTTHLFNSLTIRIRPENVTQTITFLREKIRAFDPQRPFVYSFLDVSFDAQYRAEERLGQVFSSFAVVAIFIAALGLLGLASFTAEQKTKEIGIRKVLGASIPGIIFLLTKEFTKWVVISNIIAWPVAYLATKSWLQGFAYRTGISISVFLLASIISLGIAITTVGFQAYRAAAANPAGSLKYE